MHHIHSLVLSWIELMV